MRTSWESSYVLYVNEPSALSTVIGNLQPAYKHNVRLMCSYSVRSLAYPNHIHEPGDIGMYITPSRSNRAFVPFIEALPLLELNLDWREKIIMVVVLKNIFDETIIL